MTEARLIDGLTGELIGGQSNVFGTTNTQYVNNSTYQTGAGYQSGAGYQTGTGFQQTGAGYAYNSGVAQYGAQLVGQHQQVGQSQIVNTVVNTGKEVIKGESRIEYVPYERKVMEYRD